MSDDNQGTTTKKQACSGSTEAPCYTERFKQLMRFYDVSTMEDLIDEQYMHIGRLQAKLRPIKGTEPSGAREG